MAQTDEQHDRSIADAALREAQEELALDPSHVEILGALDVPEYALGNRSRVWAIVVGCAHLCHHSF
jgi:8-oxo-dGTP pyrophosphatase MutT (NUDIX family)